MTDIKMYSVIPRYLLVKRTATNEVSATFHVLCGGVGTVGWLFGKMENLKLSHKSLVKKNFVRTGTQNTCPAGTHDCVKRISAVLCYYLRILMRSLSIQYGIRGQLGWEGNTGGLE